MATQRPDIAMSDADIVTRSVSPDFHLLKLIILANNRLSIRVRVRVRVSWDQWRHSLLTGLDKVQGPPRF